MTTGLGKRYRTAIVRSPLARHRALATALRLASALLLAAAEPAAAGLFKCLADDGTVTYQEEPCPPGRELRDFERDPAPVSVIPFRVAPEPADSAKKARAAPPVEKAERASRKAAERTGNATERKFLAPGIGEGEVVARVGRPDVSSGAGRKTMRWTYLPTPDDPATITTLTFELGRLVQVERKVMQTP